MLDKEAVNKILKGEITPETLEGFQTLSEFDTLLEMKEDLQNHLSEMEDVKREWEDFKPRLHFARAIYSIARKSEWLASAEELRLKAAILETKVRGQRARKKRRLSELLTEIYHYGGTTPEVPDIKGKERRELMKELDEALGEESDPEKVMESFLQVWKEREKARERV